MTTLEATYAENGRARLIESGFGVLAPDERVVDLFCGAGGWGEGAKELGIGVDFAVNHSAQAIATHQANNPWCVHHEGDAWKAEPRLVVGGERLFRMLRPSELAKAMGFRDDFVWPKTQRETVRLIGNAVSPPQARALVGAVFPGGKAGAA